MENLGENLNFAKKLTISLVKSPLYAELTINADKELKQHFKNVRKLKLNEHFSIRNILDENSIYQFKVVDVEPKSDEYFLVDNERTTLVQNESRVKDYWQWPEEEKFKIVEEYSKEIEKTIEFYKRFHETDQEALPMMLLHGPSGSGKSRCVEAVCAKHSFHLCKMNAVNLVGDSASAVEKRIENFFLQSLTNGPCIVLIKSFHFLFKLKDINEFNKRVTNAFFACISRIKAKLNEPDKEDRLFPTFYEPSWFFVICTTSSKQSIDYSINSYFNYELEIKSLDEAQRRLFLDMEKVGFNLSENEMNDFLKRTNGFYYGEMQTFLNFLKQETRKRSNLTFADCLNIALRDFLKNRKFQQENKLNIDSVGWKDVGGLANIKQIITDTILLPLNYPKLFTTSESKIGITRSGILLYGPPGTGKTLLAKAISNECGLNFLSVKGPELLDMYVGQTEQNVRALFEKAKLNSPCVLFFDELDSLAPIRGRAGDSGGVMDRVVSQLLTEIDGLDKFSSASNEKKSTMIFLIGATNRPDLIDTSLLRPGRFDKLVYVPVAQSFEERLGIFKALCRKLPIESTFDYEEFVRRCPMNLSGADFFSLTNKARHEALKRIINNYETSLNLNDEDILISEEDFRNSLLDLKPTLNNAALEDYKKYFNNYSNKN